MEGAAAGAGMRMVCACDVIVAARSARFVPLFTRLGLVDELVEPGETLEKALKIAHEYDDCVPLSVALVKEAFSNGVPNLASAGQIEVDFVPC